MLVWHMAKTRGRSLKVKLALELVKAGMTRYRAAKKAKIALSTIYRAAKSEALPSL